MLLALSLLILFAADAAGIGGAAMVGGLARPEAAGPAGPLATAGALRSFVTAFRSLIPPELISERSAPYEDAILVGS